MLRPHLRFTAPLFLLLLPLGAQSLTLSVDHFDLKMLKGGPLPAVAAFNITTTGAWTAASSNGDVVNLDKAQGTGNATVSVIPVDWQNPGKFTATVTVSSAGTAYPIAITLEVVARTPSTYVYIDGPHNCTDASGFDPGNAAICVVPDERPPGGFLPPAVGQTYKDPNFGATVRVIGGPRSIHGYSTPSPISAKSKYALITVNDNVTVVALLTGKKVLDNISAFGPEGAVWDAVNENYLYGYSGSKILRLDVSSGKVSTVTDYSGQFKSITAAGTAEKSKDNWFSFFASAENQICAFDLNTVKTYCAVVPDGLKVDFPTMAKGIDQVTGKRYVLGLVNGPILIYSVNQAQGRLDLEGRGPENVLMAGGNRDGICDAGEQCVNGSHGDTLEDSKGNQLFVTALEGQTPCEYSLYSIRLNKGVQMGLPEEFGGGLKRLFQMFRCGGDDKWVDFHTGCATASPDCVISITSSEYNKARDPNDTSPVVHTSHMGEILVVHDNGVDIRRLMEHRSLQFTNEEASGYWSTPRGALSPDGGYVIATSNFGVPNQQQVIVITTGLTTPRLVEGNPVLNAASYLPPLSPGTLAIAFGQYFTPDVQSAAFPLPFQLDGVQVKVANIPAHIFSVTPEQIAFLVPDQAPTSGDVPLEVTAAYPGLDEPVVMSATIPDKTISTLAPAIFAQTIPGSSYQGALLYDANWNQVPLGLGDYGIVFALGLGPTLPSVAVGDAGPVAEPLARVAIQPTVYINDTRQELLYAGLVPGMSSVYQIVFRIDRTTPIKPDNNFIWLNLQGLESPRLLMNFHS